MSGKKLGYLRTSKEEQNTDRQLHALQYLCDQLFIEKISAVAAHRPVYEKLMKQLKAGDTLVVLDLDRAYRDANDALSQLKSMQQRGIQLQIVTMQIDPATPHGKLIYTIISGVAEYERFYISKRTKEGLAAAKAKGIRLGRPTKLTDQQITRAKQRLQAGDILIRDIAEEYGVSPWTITRSIKRLEAMPDTT